MTAKFIGGAIVLTVLAGLGACTQRGSAGGGATAGARSTGAPPAPTAPPADLAGYTTPQQFDRHAAPSRADVRFYLQVMPAAIARLQHPPAGDQAALAYYRRWQSAGTQANQRALAAARAGDYAAAATAANGALPRTPQVELAQELQNGGASHLVAEQYGMPERQWNSLADAVEAAANPCRQALPSLPAPRLAQAFQNWSSECYGGDSNDPLAGLSAAQMRQADQQAAQDIRSILAARQAVAPYAARVRVLQLQYACAIPGVVGKQRCQQARLVQAMEDPIIPIR